MKSLSSTTGLTTRAATILPTRGCESFAIPIEQESRIHETLDRERLGEMCCATSTPISASAPAVWTECGILFAACRNCVPRCPRLRPVWMAIAWSHVRTLPEARILFRKVAAVVSAAACYTRHWTTGSTVPHSTSLFPSVAWCSQLRGWGASEACVGVKAFFTGATIVHLRGPLSRHRFERRSSTFPISWEEVYRNQAIIARVCFEVRTWNNFWLEFFEPHLSAAIREELNSPVIEAERAAFAGAKVRSDREFWTLLLGRPAPVGI